MNEVIGLVEGFWYRLEGYWEGGFWGGLVVVGICLVLLGKVWSIENDRR